jgi:hypothetical protein
MDAPPRGPYVQAALFADMILEDKTGTLSAIRIIDRITHVVGGPNPPDDMPPVNRQLNALIALKPGGARGRQNFKLWQESPDGQRTVVGEGTFHFAGAPNTGANLQLVLNVTFRQEGVFYFDVEVEGQLLTRMPVEVRYNRVTTGRGPATPEA